MSSSNDNTKLATTAILAGSLGAAISYYLLQKKLKSSSTNNNYSSSTDIRHPLNSKTSFIFQDPEYDIGYDINSSIKSESDASTFTKGNIKNQFVESSGQSFTESSITNNGDGTGSFALKAGANGRAEAQDGSVSFSGNTGGTATGTFDEDGVVEVERTGKANGRLENEEGNFSGNAKAEATQVSRKLVFDSSFKYAHSYVSSSCHMSSIDPQPRWNLCY